MGGGKKRKSVNKLASTGAEQNADTNKRIVHSNGNDSDYGVFSDPDEASDDKQPQSPTSPHSYIVELTPAEAIIEDASQSQTVDLVIQEAEDNADKVSSETTESIIILDKSLDTLKMKLEKDVVYSNKTTLTSFFSYIILAMEIDIACSSTTATSATHNLAGYDSTNAERLIEYIIRNHSSTPEVEQFTLTMLQLGIVTHIMNGVIEFNRTARASTDSSNHSHTLQTLQSLEHLDVDHKKTATPTTPTTATTPAQAPTPATTQAPAPTPKQPNRFIRFWRNMSLCCCKCRKSRKDSILESTSNDSDESNKSDEATPKKNEEVSSLNQSNAGEEMKELTL
jgi:hypothetical protein